ncbi:Outer membrane protein beta-barrel domain protein [anaerobic digester metagenome]
MKKILLLLLLVPFGLGAGFAQKGFNIQLVVQPGKSGLNGDMYSKTVSGYTNAPIYKDFTFGLSGGINGVYNFTNHFGISTGLGYSHQGQNYTDFELYEPGDSTSPYAYENTVSLSYLTIPLRLIVSTNTDNSFSFSCHAGVYLGVLLSYKNTYKKNFGTTSYYTETMQGESITVDYYNVYSGSFTKEYELVGKPFKSIDFGLTLGTGVQKKISDKLAVQIILNYQMGFGDVKNLNCKYSPSTDPNRQLIHRNYLFGLMFGFKKTF